MGGWRFALTDLNGRSLGELRAYGRKVTLGVSRMSVASGQIRADDPMWETLASGESRLMVHDHREEMVFYGPVVTDEEEGQGQGSLVNFQAADLSWELTKRFVGKKTAATDPDLVYANDDSGAIMFNILNRANADEATGIQPGVQDSFVRRDATYAWKRAFDALNELAAIDGSYEWALRYMHTMGSGMAPDVFLDLKTAFGTTRSQVVFEYGTGRKNCQAYKRTRTIDAQGTHIWALGSGPGQFAAASDPAAALQYRRREEVVSFGDISVASLLGVLASAHVAVRSKPRVVVSLTPFPKLAPVFGDEWEIGDIVQARVVVRGKVRVSGFVRIWGATFDLDELGNVKPTLELVAP